MPPTVSDEASARKRQKPNVGSALKKQAGPDYEKGITYWNDVEASVDGVLGGFGNGPVPHIEQLSSRLFLLSLLPSLHTCPSPLTPSPPQRPSHRLTALDVGAGIGRVTKNVLLPLFDDVVLLEPVQKFVQEAHRSAASGEWRELPKAGRQPAGEGMEMDKWKEDSRRVKEAEEGRGKRVLCVQGGLQGFDPAYPLRGGKAVGVVGEAKEGEGAKLGEEEEEVVYDAIWCQWCLGHMSHSDLVTFLRRSRDALRKPPAATTESTGSVHTSLIFVKENVCEDAPWGKGKEFLDPEDSTLTRSNLKWLEVFQDAGLEVVKEEIQKGMPQELFMVKTWALR